MLQLKKSKGGAAIALLFLCLAYYADQPGEAGMGFYFLSIPWSLLIEPLLLNWPTVISDACNYHYDDHWYCIWEMRLLNMLSGLLMWCCAAVNALILYCLFGGLRPRKKQA